LGEAVEKARHASDGLSLKEKSRILHSILDDIARSKKYHLKPRKR
jgi:hypothetical protein